MPILRFVLKIRGLKIFRYLGPGILVTVGFIDPGNWAANLAAGSIYGYKLLWVITASTIMLIVLQHNAAHLGIATGYCLAESTYMNMPNAVSKSILGSAFIASISTAVAEVLGAAIAINMLFKVNIKFASLGIFLFLIILIIATNYKKLEKLIIILVTIISFCFIYELSLFDLDWQEIIYASTVPSIPQGSLYLIVAALGAVVMPHNLFLHSEIIQTKRWFTKNKVLKKKLLKFEFIDTLLSMILGWGINSIIIILAAQIFFKNNIVVEELSQAAELLRPLLGSKAWLIFALALLLAGVSSSITAGLSGGIILSGIFNKEYNPESKLTKAGVAITLLAATIIILFIKNPLMGLIYSQVILSMQLPITIFAQLYLTSSKKVMGEYANKTSTNIILFICASFVTILNVVLLVTL